jgi:hypothetical protein
MKPILLLLFSILTIHVYGQTSRINTDVARNSYSQLNDSIPQVIYKYSSASQQNIAWFVNDQLVGDAVTKTINPDQIASINVEKKGVVIDRISYDSKVTITMKTGYHPKMISLNDLKEKYTDVKDSPVLFMFENDIVRSDYSNYMVDENFILQIIVDKVELKDEMRDFYLIKLLTRNDENVKKAKEIRIR